MSIDMSYFNARFKFPQRFPEGCAPYGQSFKRPGFYCSSAQPYDQAFGYCLSVKTQTQGLLPLFNFSITAKKTGCNSAHQANLSLPFPIRVVAFQTGWCLFTLEMPPTNQAALCWSVISLQDTCPSDNKIQQLLTQFHNQSQGKEAPYS